MKRENTHFSNDQVTRLKNILLSEREKLKMKDKTQEAFCLDKNELSDVLDEATVNIETSRMLRLRNRELFYFRKITKTLGRIEKGIFGLCDDCDAPIQFERLLARPTAELCIHCKEEAEHSEKNNFIQRKSKSLGKTMAEIGTH